MSGGETLTFTHLMSERALLELADLQYLYTTVENRNISYFHRFKIN